MYSTLAYLYQQIHMVILLDASGTYNSIRYRPVFSKDLKASKGVDNVILIRFMNQEQKPVDITGLTFTFRVMSRDGTQLLLSKELETVTASQGHTKLTLVESELDEIVAQKANYSITVDRNSLTEPVFVDDQAGSRGVIEILDAAMPEFEASSEITVAANPGDSSAVYSSQWNPENYLQTVQYNLTDFEGTITVETSATGNAPWYELETVQYDSGATTASKYFNVEGWHSKMRLRVEYTSGTIDAIYVR
jgi:hypothetical protein